ncbi:hypothetical protein ACFO1B_33430 [Dactylosporangium siamense]|uniref:Uncharacterized protein n=1 Tax=Dactylosporangium siamense TaxID=685454 RepID=A0A919PEJ9_9ACTN|nr:hypothetical protein [Dactylosporangium siamense]GIG42494.1 hypothetical protein Dsi01nite_005350 [Dactylosporangium siamense]
MDFDEEVAAAAVTAPGDDLIQLALEAIRAVAADDAWFTTRLGPGDSARSRQAVAVIAGVLADHRAISG